LGIFSWEKAEEAKALLLPELEIAKKEEILNTKKKKEKTYLLTGLTMVSVL
jgi:hypothetical protein